MRQRSGVSGLHVRGGLWRISESRGHHRYRVSASAHRTPTRRMRIRLIRPGTIREAVTAVVTRAPAFAMALMSTPSPSAAIGDSLDCSSLCTPHKTLERGHGRGLERIQAFAFVMKPTPRIFTINEGEPGMSIFFRRLLIWASTTLVSSEKWNCHTFSSSIVRVITRPG